MPVETSSARPAGSQGSPWSVVKWPPRRTRKTSVVPFWSPVTRSEASDSNAARVVPWPSCENEPLRDGPLGKPPAIERDSRWVSRSFVGSKAWAAGAAVRRMESAAAAPHSLEERVMGPEEGRDGGGGFRLRIYIGRHAPGLY